MKNENSTDNGRLAYSLGRVFGYLLIVLAPALVGVLVWYVLASSLRLWRLSQSLTVFTFVLTLVIVSAVISVLLIRYARSKEERNTVDYIVSIVVVPFLVSLAANLVPVSEQDTFVTLLVRNVMSRDEYVFVTNLGDAIISSSSVETQQAGIETLQAIHSEATLDELFRVFEQDPVLIYNYPLYDTLSYALASYGLQARGRLLTCFYESTQATGGIPRGVGFDLYARYFDESFEGLKAQIYEEAIDLKEAEAQILELETAELQLKTMLQKLEQERPYYVDPTMDFVLETFVRMDNLNEDAEIYSLAKTVAADSTYTDRTRGLALLLVGQLGSRSDFDVLLPYLKSDSESIKESTFRAIGLLHAKLAGEKHDEEH